MSTQDTDNRIDKGYFTDGKTEPSDIFWFQTFMMKPFPWADGVIYIECANISRVNFFIFLCQILSADKYICCRDELSKWIYGKQYYFKFQAKKSRAEAVIHKNHKILYDIDYQIKQLFLINNSCLYCKLAFYPIFNSRKY